MAKSTKKGTKSSKSTKKSIEKAVEKTVKSMSTWQIVLVVIIVVAIVALAIYGYYNGWFDSFLHPNPHVDVVGDSALSIHFMELGNKYTGDSVYVKAGDTDILIDAGSRKNSAPVITNYVKQYCTDGILEYVIATHAHEDHIAGFVGSGNQGIFDAFECKTIIQFARTDVTSQIYSDFCTKRDAEVASGAKCYTALECVKQENGAQKVYDLSGDGNVTMEVLYQKYYEEETSNENNYSVCVLLKQKTEQGEYNYLFTGDLEGAGEKSLVQNNNLPHVQLYKGGHHGSYTAASKELMEAVSPERVCICTCAGSSEYRAAADRVFPAQDFCDRVAPYTENVYCTTLVEDYANGVVQSMNGNITMSCDVDGQIKMAFSNNNKKLKDTAWFIANRVMPDAWKNGTSRYKFDY